MDKSLHDFLSLQGFIVQEIEGDGNCLFRSIADVLDNDQEKHLRYRRLAVQHIRLHPNEFQDFLISSENSIENYLAKMAQAGTWGGHIELEALSVVLNKTFWIFNENQDLTVIGTKEEESARVYIAFDRTRFHYSSLKRD